MKEYSIKLKDLKLKDIYSINLYLENCESCTFYNNEIVDIKLDFEKTLVADGTEIIRKIKSGYLIININEKTKREKDDINIWNYKTGGTIKKPYKDKIEKRLTGVCDVCIICVKYKDCCGEESFEVPYDENSDDEGNTVSLKTCSSAKIDENGNLVILMGKASEYKAD